MRGNTPRSGRQDQPKDSAHDLHPPLPHVPEHPGTPLLRPVEQVRTPPRILVIRLRRSGDTWVNVGGCGSHRGKGSSPPKRSAPSSQRPSRVPSSRAKSRGPPQHHSLCVFARPFRPLSATPLTPPAPPMSRRRAPSCCRDRAEPPEPSRRPPPQATAAANLPYKSPGSACRSRQVIPIGCSPSCRT